MKQVLSERSLNWSAPWLISQATTLWKWDDMSVPRTTSSSSFKDQRKAKHHNSLFNSTVSMLASTISLRKRVRCSTLNTSLRTCRESSMQVNASFRMCVIHRDIYIYTHGPLRIYLQCSNEAEPSNLNAIQVAMTFVEGS